MCIRDSLSTDKTNYKIIRNDDGMLGIVDSEGRSVIEPQWDNIYIPVSYTHLA